MNQATPTNENPMNLFSRPWATRVSGPGFRSVKDPDGLSVYLTDQESKAMGQTGLRQRVAQNPIPTLHLFQNPPQ